MSASPTILEAMVSDHYNHHHSELSKPMTYTPVHVGEVRLIRKSDGAQLEIPIVTSFIDHKFPFVVFSTTRLDGDPIIVSEQAYGHVRELVGENVQVTGIPKGIAQDDAVKLSRFMGMLALGAIAKQIIDVHAGEDTGRLSNVSEEAWREAANISCHALGVLESEAAMNGGYDIFTLEVAMDAIALLNGKKYVDTYFREAIKEVGNSYYTKITQNLLDKILERHIAADRPENLLFFNDDELNTPYSDIEFSFILY